MSVGLGLAGSLAGTCSSLAVTTFRSGHRYPTITGDHISSTPVVPERRSHSLLTRPKIAEFWNQFSKIEFQVCQYRRQLGELRGIPEISTRGLISPRALPAP